MLVLPERSLEISNPPDCLRQLIFESDWEEFPYWMMGVMGRALPLSNPAICDGFHPEFAVQLMTDAKSGIYTQAESASFPVS
jgi:hypothetical protein